MMVNEPVKKATKRPSKYRNRKTAGKAKDKHTQACPDKAKKENGFSADPVAQPTP